MIDPARRSGRTARSATAEIPRASLARLSRRFNGTLIRPADDAYGASRRVWNGMIDQYPALIARCEGVDDVAAAMAFGTKLGLPIAVRGGGHSVAGFGTCDSGLVIDLSAMRGVSVDPERRTADAQGGARWADLDAATAEGGLATTGGLISTTGVAGLTLGGGIGWLMRQFGLACDNLLEADVVTPGGDVVVADERSDPELLWGLRGGGGNFGVVTRLRYRLHPMSTVIGGMLIHRVDDATRLVREWDAIVADAPDELTTLAAILTAPAAPFIPNHLQGRPILAIVVCWSGDLDAGDAALRPLRDLATPEADLVGPMAYPALQQMLDAGAPPGLRNYWKSGQLGGLRPDVIEAIAKHAVRSPSPMSQVHIHQVGGVVGRVAADATAYPHRHSSHVVNVVATWRSRADDDLNIGWARDLYAAVEPSVSGVYVNFLGDEGQERIGAAYGEPTYQRLAALKRRYDPDNVLRLNQNILPS